MNVNNSHCTNSLMRKFLSLLFLSMVSLGVSAEEDNNNGVGNSDRFDYILRRNAWSEGVHATGILRDTVSRSYAEIFLRKDNGGFVDLSSSDDSWNAGVTTSSVRHFEKVSFSGSFSYDYFDGRHMCGSMFVRPGFYPVDILEFTPGRKVKETYAFTGNVAAPLAEHWAVGLDIDFTANNYAKRKDLRHKNIRLDFDIAPGVMYRNGEFAVAAAYLLHLDREKVEAEQVGASVEGYKAFFDRGLRFGSLQLWESNDLHLTTPGVQGFPLKQTLHGVSVAAEYGALYGDVEYRTGSGNSGERDIIWHEFDTDKVDARMVLHLSSSSFQHFLRGRVGWSKVRNRENILSFENIEGVSRPVNHGSVPVFEGRRLETGAEYELKDERNDLRLAGQYVFTNRSSFLMYPYAKGQRLHYTVLTADYLRTLGHWELSVNMMVRTGGCRDTESLFEEPATPGTYPGRLTDFYNAENEYATANRMGLGASLRRNIHRFYIDLSVNWEHGFNLHYLPEANRESVMLRVGYNF